MKELGLFKGCVCHYLPDAPAGYFLAEKVLDLERGFIPCFPRKALFKADALRKFCKSITCLGWTLHPKLEDLPWPDEEVVFLIWEERLNGKTRLIVPGWGYASDFESVSDEIWNNIPESRRQELSGPLY